jgi:predicted kinase
LEAVIIVGIQGSGKSTFYKKYFYDTHVRINLDMLKTRNREKIILDACINAKQSFVVDNTNPTILDRKKYITPAKDNSFKIKGYYLKVDVNDAIKRNEQREAKKRVPIVAIKSTLNKLQPPTYDEGFDEIYIVDIDGDGNYIIEKM